MTEIYEFPREWYSFLSITFQLRAERSGRGPGRTYSIAISATDDSRNTSMVTLSCFLPHDQRK